MGYECDMQGHVFFLGGFRHFTSVIIVFGTETMIDHEPNILWRRLFSVKSVYITGIKQRNQCKSHSEKQQRIAISQPVILCRNWGFRFLQALPNLWVH